MALDSLPPELIETVGGYLELEDICNLRLVSKRCATALEGFIFRQLSIDVRDFISDKDVRGRLRSLAAGSSPANVHLRTVILTSLSLGDRRNTRRALSDDSEDEAEGLLELLRPALLACSGITNVSWRPRRSDDVATQKAVVDILSKIPTLASLVLTVMRFCPHVELVPELQKIKNLRSLSLINHSRGSMSCRLLEGAPAIIENSPDLSFLTLEDSEEEAPYSLQKLLSTQSNPLPLRHLVLGGSLINPAPPSYHFHQLKSLVLRGVCSLRDRSYQSMPNSPAQAFWEQLSALAIKLEEIDVDHTPPACMDYLASYTGLKSLAITVKGFTNRLASDASADILWGRVIDAHATTLRALRVNCIYGGKWAYNATRTTPPLARCTSLRSLGLPIAPVAPAVTNNRGSELAFVETLGGSGLNALFDDIMLNLPFVRSFGIEPATKTLSTWLEPAPGLTESIAFLREAIQEEYLPLAVGSCVSTYTRPASGSLLETISFRESVWRARHDYDAEGRRVTTFQLASR